MDNAQAGAKAVLDMRAVMASNHWDRFLEYRLTSEAQKFHPQRKSLADFQPALAV
jgi:hypothetical protein